MPNNLCREQTTITDHWNQHARQWNVIGSPLRPCVEDIDLLGTLLAPRAGCAPVHARQVLLFGVTPEIAAMPWSDGTRLLALDRSVDMIAHVWRADGVFPGHAVCGDWSQIPLADGSCDLVAGDGCFTLLNYPDGYQDVLRAVRRVLKPEGLFAMRFFLRPAEPERVETVVADLWAKRIGNFHIFKWRLAMAMHGALESGICLGEVWNRWREAVPDPDELIHQLGWSPASVASINCYQDIVTCYTFPTLNEVREIFGAYFTEIDCRYPNYELGERCPTLLWR